MVGDRADCEVESRDRLFELRARLLSWIAIIIAVGDASIIIDNPQRPKVDVSIGGVTADALNPWTCVANDLAG